VFRIRDLSHIREEPIDPSAVYRILLVSIVAVVLLMRLALKRPDWLPFLFQGLVGAVSSYAFISIASALWSIYPAWTLYKSTEYLVTVALLAAIVATVRSIEGYKTLFDWTWVLLAGLLGTVWLGAVLWPDKAFIPTDTFLRIRLNGVLPAVDQTLVGEDAAILAIVALCRLQFQRYRGRKVFYWAVLGCALITLLISQTRAAIGAFFLGATLVLLLSRRFKVMAVLGLAIALLCAIPSLRDSASTFWARGQSAETISAYDGRLPVWQFALNKILERPIIGYGAYAGSRFVVVAGAQDDTTGSSTLNDYVELLIGTGICGLIPIVSALVGAWWYLVRALGENHSSALGYQLNLEALGILAASTLHSFFDVNMIWHPALVFLLIVGYAEFLRRRLTQIRRPSIGVIRAPSISPE
jgi:O-antigen ligase